MALIGNIRRAVQARVHGPSGRPGGRAAAERATAQLRPGGAKERPGGSGYDPGMSPRMAAESQRRRALMSEPDAPRTPRPLPNRTGLPDRLKTGIETLSGLSMDDVRVHRNSSRPAGLEALAYTQGSDIHVASGQERHLAHEAWHVVQQKQGRVRPTLSLKGVPINDAPGLEQEADALGRRALQTKPKATRRG